MKLRKLKLRGAIGILKGMNQEEIEIDFTQYPEGLIALVGRNGKGKTTIIENLQPFRQLVSRDGNLSDHFILKDSYRMLDFEYNGKVYSAQIYIDGETKKQEAYLFEEIDGRSRPLNDGKVTTYDAEIEKMFGSETLFFNSVFSAQKSKGVAGLSAGERRELFYEILSLNEYESYCEEAKQGLKDAEQRLTELLSKKNLLEEQLQVISVLDDSSLQNKKEAVEENIMLLETALSNLNNTQKVHEFDLFRLQQQKEEQTNLQKQIEQITREIDQIEEDCKREQDPIENRYKNQLAELEQRVTTLPDDTMLLKEKEELTKKIEAIQDEAGTKIDGLEAEQEDIELEMMKCLSYINQESQINTAYAEVIEAQAQIMELEKKQTELLMQEMELQNAFKGEAFELEAKYNVIRTDEQIKLLQQKVEILTEQKTKIITDQKLQEKAMENEVSTIQEVPCTKKVGQSCKFLLRAYETLENLPKMKQQFETELSDHISKIQQAVDEIGKLEAEKKEKDARRVKELDALVEKYSEQLGMLKAKIDKNSLHISNYKAICQNAEMIVTNKQKLDESIQNMETNRLKQISIQDNIKRTKEATELQIKSELVKIELLNNKIQTIENERLNFKNILENDKLAIINHYKNDLKLIETKYNERKNNLINQKEMLNNKIDNELLVKISAKNETLNRIISERIKQEEEILLEKEFLAKIVTEIAENNARIDRKKELQAQIQNINTQEVENEVREYAVLVSAFDKTGIPVLKLENSAHEITLLANELLQLFDNQFRIAIETLRPTKDGKKMKEVFEISVIDADGVTELKNKSGGQQVWIETAIQLAIGLFLRNVSRKIQTAYLDEKDGALDLDSAFVYKQMIEQAHERAGVSHTIVITHRPELVNLIDNKIILGEEITTEKLN